MRVQLDPWPCSVGWGSGVAKSCGIGHRRGSDPELLWLWRRLVATAPIGPLAWEPPYASGAALKITKKKTKVHLSLPRCLWAFHFSLCFSQILLCIYISPMQLDVYYLMTCLLYLCEISFFPLCKNFLPLTLLFILSLNYFCYPLPSTSLPSSILAHKSVFVSYCFGGFFV